MLLRPYQIEAVDATMDAFERTPSVLGVAATGLGKTILFATILSRFPGRAMVIAHREELIWQAADKIKRAAGISCDVEMADMRAAEYSMHGKARCIVSTVQTQIAGRNGGRMMRFKPDEFDLLVIDEAHHAVASTYKRVIKYYRQNPNLKVLGVTATPDRADEEALGQIFDAVAFEYDIRFGIEDGWLVPVTQRIVHAKDLDLSACRTTAGDLNGADLAKVMEEEKPLHEVASPTLELAGDRRTLIFASSLAHAERLCEILNRHHNGCARWVSGGTPKPDRRQLFADYAAAKFQFLVNVGVATEGFDDPGIEVVVMARPTKSRSLYAQMIGRGTRPLPAIVDNPDFFGSDVMRREAIASSTKCNVEIIDFVGNAGRHRLVSATDILAGNYTDDVVEAAKKEIEASGSADVEEALKRAEKKIQDDDRRARERAARRRANIRAKAHYHIEEVDPFSVLNIRPWRETAFERGKPPTPNMLKLLKSQHVDNADKMTFAQAKRLCAEISRRFRKKLASYAQAKVLEAHGHSSEVSRREASRIIYEIQGGRRPAQPKPAVQVPARLRKVY